VCSGQILKLSFLHILSSYKDPATHSQALFSQPGFDVSPYGTGVTKSHNEIGPNVPCPLVIVTTPKPWPRIVPPDGSVTAASYVPSGRCPCCSSGPPFIATSHLLS
jgi:hypothetical protein